MEVAALDELEDHLRKIVEESSSVAHPPRRLSMGPSGGWGINLLRRAYRLVRRKDLKTATLAMVREDPPAEPDLRFRELYDRHSRAVFLAALRVTGNPADAEDVLQTVFLRVFDRELMLAPEQSSAYLRRAAVNASIDLLRYKKIRPETATDGGKEYLQDTGLRVAESQEDNFALKQRLRAALARLSPENAELITLCYLEGYSYDELADLLQIERGTVGSRLHRIRAALKQELSD